MREFESREEEEEGVKGVRVRGVRRIRIKGGGIEDDLEVELEKKYKELEEELEEKLEKAELEEKELE
ncbi:hypothetical protein HPP92_009866 [Vanilla planifolia]|uniref:Uncharacterized protein n=1 Tax=Vanilla planifolia TaxID=51239 RepID=A0A835R9E4_VANPL|nr:hypothetical protein HPP92_009866 [Vanilla planifolia]